MPSELTAEERTKLKKSIGDIGQKLWFKKQIVKLMEAKQMGASPHAIHKINLIKGKTISQLKGRYYELPSIHELADMSQKEMAAWADSRWPSRVKKK